MSSLIIYNGKVASESLPNATAVAVRDRQIIYIGNDHVALSHRSNDTEVIDLRGATVIPGFVDGHGHLLGLGTRLTTLHLHDCTSSADVAAHLRAWIASREKGEWVIGMGWNQERWDDRQFPTKNILDTVAPDTPVYLTRIDGHAAWLNSAALRRAGIDRVADIDGGAIIADDHGQPTGVLIDNAMQRVTALLPEEDDEKRASSLRAAIAHLHAHGVTMLHDMDVAPRVLPVLRSILESPAYHLRVSSWLSGQNFEWRHAWSVHDNVSLRNQFDSEWLRVDGIKFYVDGALGSRGAFLSAPYADAPATHGLRLLDPASLAARIDAAINDGFGVAVHAIGDAAVREALDGFERARKKNPSAVLRLEHAQMVHPDDIGRFASHDVFVSVQPSQRVSDRDWLPDRIGERAAWTFPLHELRRSGAHLIGGSDVPIEVPDCLAGIRAAMGGEKKQRLTQAEALSLFTVWGRRATSFEEAHESLAINAPADLTVLSGFPDTDEPIAVLGTIVGGTIVYRRGLTAV